MAEVEAQMQANGLPTHFESSSNQPSVINSATNDNATISNAGISELKNNTAEIAIKTVSQPVQPPPVSQQHDDMSNSGIAPEKPSSLAAAQGDIQSNGATVAEEANHDTTATNQPSDSVSSVLPDQPLENGQHVELAASPETVPVRETSEPNVAIKVGEDVLKPIDELAAVSSSAPASDQQEVALDGDANTALDSNIVGQSTPSNVETALSAKDEEMTDVPVVAPKPVHERDDDMADSEPLAKRIRTDRTHSDPSESLVSGNITPRPNSSTDARVEDDAVINAVRLSHMKKVISNLKKSGASLHFRTPVDYVALKIPSYPSVIPNPMDLGTVDAKLKRGEYKTVSAFIADFDQIHKNSITFNGPEHQVSQMGAKMSQSFHNQMKQLPSAKSDEPPKKMMKPPLPISAPPSRRASTQVQASSPKPSTPSQTFAPNPDGMPLIRRDSALGNRPQRAIVPPKRNSGFGVRPKKKKYELELRFCDETLRGLTAQKHWVQNQYFLHPVDPVALNIPHYFNTIKKPMDLGTVKEKLQSGEYERARDFEEDVRLIFKNCYLFNPPGDYVYERGVELEKVFNDLWSKKADWIRAREPDSQDRSEADEEEEESEEDAEADSDDEEGDENLSEVQRLQKEMMQMQKRLADLQNQDKKKKSPGASKKKKSVKPEPHKSKFPGLHKAKATPDPPKPVKKIKQEKDRYVTFAEKQYISNGIGMLPERQMNEALKLIQDAVPNLQNGDGGEVELDIEDVPNATLIKLLSFVKKYAGPPPDEPQIAADQTSTTTKSKSKKLSKADKESRQAELSALRQGLSAYGGDQVHPSVERDESDDGDDSAESEED